MPGDTCIRDLFFVPLWLIVLCSSGSFNLMDYNEKKPIFAQDHGYPC